MGAMTQKFPFLMSKQKNTVSYIRSKFGMDLGVMPLHSTLIALGRRGESSRKTRYIWTRCELIIIIITRYMKNL